MPSTFGVVLILLGGFIAAVGYQMVTECSSMFSNGNCWDPQQFPTALGFYLGFALVILGVVLLVSGDVLRLLRKLSG